jgi:hypothetical protein
VTLGSGPQDAFSEINLDRRRRIFDGNPRHDIFKRFSHVSDELRCELRHSSTHSCWWEKRENKSATKGTFGKKLKKRAFEFPRS